jgi:hypothetical protein
MGEYIRRKVRVAISEEELKETRAAWDWRWGEVEWHEYVEEEEGWMSRKGWMGLGRLESRSGKAEKRKSERKHSKKMAREQ